MLCITMSYNVFAYSIVFSIETLEQFFFHETVFSEAGTMSYSVVYPQEQHSA